ncbi:MAG TPA: hypothetical protein VIR98_03655 [Candidatus Paceibacterota bacterium]|jgi:hypothetical protein
MLRFFGTKVGIALIIAALSISVATYAKFRNPSASDNSIAVKIDSIAEKSVKNAIESGQLDTSDWEKVLETIQGSSTIDDKIATLSQTPDSNTDIKPLTATDRFAQRFFEEYVKLKGSGATIDENTSVNLVNKLLSQDYGSAASSEKSYTPQDIVILTDSSTAALKKYGNTLGSALSQPLPEGYVNELTLLNQAYESGDTSGFEKMALNIARYQQIRTLIAGIPVPKTFSNAHIALLNSISAIIEGVRGMTLIDSDPVGATQMILRYEDGIKALDLSTREIASFFKRQNISFSTSESGYIFSQ